MGRKKRKKRKGELYLTEDGLWECRVNLGKTNKGYVYKTYTSDSKEEVIQQLYHIKSLYIGYKPTDRSLMTYEEWFDYWYENIKKPMIRFNTQKKYECIYKNYIQPIIGKKALIKLSPIHFEKLKGELHSTIRQKERKKIKSLSDTTIKETLLLVRQSLQGAMNEKLILENPMTVTIPKNNYFVPTIMDGDEINKFLALLKGNEWYDYIFVDLFTGLRKGEITGLKWSDFIEETKELFVQRTAFYYYDELHIEPTKTDRSTRKLILADSVVELLKERKKVAKSEWIFPDFDNVNLPVKSYRIGTFLERFYKQHNLKPLRFHDFRHTYATQAIGSGVDEESLSMIMGHSRSIFTLSVYTHNSKDLKIKTANVISKYLEEILGECNE